MTETKRARIGIDVGRKLRLEDALSWAVEHDVRILDMQLDTGANAVTGFPSSRSAAIRATCDQHGLRLGLHTNSAVNTAEYAPLVGEAVDAYLRAYIEVAARLGAGWIVVHAGLHFTTDLAQRMNTALARLDRVSRVAERAGVRLLLENLNKEPADAEVHYMADTIEAWRWFYERLDSPALRLSFTANHAHLVPEGVDGFLDVMPLDRVDEVRLADCRRNGKEEHLLPGQGDFDFAALFLALETRGYAGHYMNAFGGLDDMLQARDLFASINSGDKNRA